MKKITPDQIDAHSIKDSVLLYPTETVYGLGCSIHDIESLEKIYLIKGRPAQKKVITLVDSLEQAKSLAWIIPDEERLLLSGLSLTLLLAAKETSPKHLISEKNLISVRKTTHPVCLQIIKQLGAPLVSTSANISGSPAVVNLKDLPQKLIDECDVVIDAGELPPSNPSTIVRIQDDQIHIVREGAVTTQAIQELLK